MNKYQNMKIEINEHQLLNEVVRELERLGFTPCMQAYWSDKWVATNNDKYAVFSNDMWIDWKLTTLDQLKAMEN